MNTTQKEWEDIWKKFCSKTIIPRDVSDERIAEIEKSSGPDMGILMEMTARPVNSMLRECHFPIIVDGKYRICGKPGIKAHCISKSAFLDILSSEYHLMQMKEKKIPMSKAKGGHQIISQWSEVGKGEASVFRGICKKHDNDVFKSIDEQFLDTDKKEYLFLLAFRPIIQYHWEYYNTLNTLKKIDLKRRKPDMIPDDAEIDRHRKIANTMLTKWFSEWNMRASKNFENIIHIEREWQQNIPTVAFSKVIGMSTVAHPTLWLPPAEKDVFFVLNVLPYKGKARSTISICGGEDYSILRKDMPQLFSEESSDMISSAMVSNSKGLYLSKEYFNKISDEQKAWMCAARERFRLLEGHPAMGDAFYNILSS